MSELMIFFNAAAAAITYTLVSFYTMAAAAALL
jgi:hypothetical protein